MFSSKLREELSKLVAERRWAARVPAPGDVEGPVTPFPREVRETARTSAGPAPLEAHETVRTPAGVEEYLPGAEVATESGPLFVHECLVSGFREDAADLRAGYGRIEAGTLAPSWEQGQSLLADLGASPGRALFLDLETTGLQGAVLFLAGFMAPISGDFVVRQLFARDYSEEKALL